RPTLYAPSSPLATLATLLHRGATEKGVGFGAFAPHREKAGLSCALRDASEHLPLRRLRWRGRGLWPADEGRLSDGEGRERSERGEGEGAGSGPRVRAG